MAVNKHVTLEHLSTFAIGFAAKTDERYVQKTALPSYEVRRQASAEEGFLATYQLFSIVGESGSEVETAVGTKINIPKDYLVKSATLETCQAADTPVAGYQVGDKYIDFTVNTVGSDGNTTHFYINVKDLVDEYTAGNGLVLTDSEFAVQVDAANANGLGVTAAGIKLDLAVAADPENSVAGSAGAMSAADKAKVDAIDYATTAEINAILAGLYT